MPLPTAMFAAIDTIYDAALNYELWPSALRRICGVVESTSMVVALEEAGTRRLVASYGIPPEALRDYAAHYHHVDPMRAFIERSPVGIYSSRQVVPKQILHKREIFGDFGLLHGLAYCMQGFLFREESRAATVSMCRPAGKDEFELQDVEILARLAPHLQRALKVQIAVGAAASQANTLAAALDRWPTAVFAVDAGGLVTHINQSANNLVLASDGLGIRESRLCANTASQTSRLNRLLKRALGDGSSACEGGSMLLERSFDRKPLSIQVVPQSKHGPFGTAADVLVFASDPETANKANQQRLQQLYNLTRSEAALADLISSGVGVRAAAQSLGIAPSTARTHLRRTFEKTGVGRQAELANLVGRSRLSGD